MYLAYLAVHAAPPATPSRTYTDVSIFLKNVIDIGDPTVPHAIFMLSYLSKLTFLSLSQT